MSIHGLGQYHGPLRAYADGVVGGPPGAALDSGALEAYKDGSLGAIQSSFERCIASVFTPCLKSNQGDVLGFQRCVKASHRKSDACFTHVDRCRAQVRADCYRHFPSDESRYNGCVSFNSGVCDQRHAAELSQFAAMYQRGRAMASRGVWSRGPVRRRPGEEAPTAPAGLGEYFSADGLGGLGEYFSEPGTAGLGQPPAGPLMSYRDGSLGQEFFPGPDAPAARIAHAGFGAVAMPAGKYLLAGAAVGAAIGAGWAASKRQKLTTPAIVGLVTGLAAVFVADKVATA